MRRGDRRCLRDCGGSAPTSWLPYWARLRAASAFRRRGDQHVELRLAAMLDQGGGEPWRSSAMRRSGRSGSWPAGRRATRPIIDARFDRHARRPVQHLLAGLPLQREILGVPARPTDIDTDEAGLARPGRARRCRRRRRCRRLLDRSAMGSATARRRGPHHSVRGPLARRPQQARIGRVLAIGPVTRKVPGPRSVRVPLRPSSTSMSWPARVTVALSGSERPGGSFAPKVRGCGPRARWRRRRPLPPGRRPRWTPEQAMMSIEKEVISPSSPRSDQTLRLLRLRTAGTDAPTIRN